MAALQCEICGGKLMAKAGGIFECDSCGMQYDKTRIQEMLQEIRGTVKIEGTVQVAGAVKIDGPVEVKNAGPTVEGLLARGNMELEKGRWDNARESFYKALEIDPRCGEAYGGLICARYKRGAFSLMGRVEAEIYTHSKDFQNARQFAQGEFREVLLKAEAESQERSRKAQEWEAVRQAEKQTQQEQAQKKSEEEKRRLTPIRKKLAPLQKLLSAYGGNVVGLQVDGNMTVKGNFLDLVAVSAGRPHVLMLKADGTAVTTLLEGTYLDYNKQNGGFLQIWEWRDLVAVAAGKGFSVGLRSDGTVVTAGLDSTREKKVSEWKDLVTIAAGDRITVGINREGRILSTGIRYPYGTEYVAVSIEGEENTTYGLKADGTVWAGRTRTGVWDYAPDDDKRDAALKNWEGIVAIASGYKHTVGLRCDGTVVAYGDNTAGQCEVSQWKNIVALAAGNECTYGLRADGSVQAAGKPGKEVASWRLFRNPATVQEVMELYRERRKLGIFDGRQKKEIDARIADLEVPSRRR